MVFDQKLKKLTLDKKKVYYIFLFYLYDSLFLSLGNDDVIGEDKEVDRLAFDPMASKQFLVHLELIESAFPLELPAHGH